MKTTTKRAKYEYLKIIQGCYDGKTWDDCCAYDARDAQSLKECRADYRRYRENESQYPHRLIERRVPRSECAFLTWHNQVMRKPKYRAVCGDWNRESSNIRELVREARRAARTAALPGHTADWHVERIGAGSIVAIGGVDMAGKAFYSSPYPQYADPLLVRECRQAN